MARLALAVGLVTVATMLAEATGCSSTSSNQGAADGSTMTPDGQDGAALDAGGPAACVAAGGQCLVGGGGDICAVVGPQDCNPDRGPSGSYCCLEKASGVDAAADCADANIMASSYVQSCKVDTDCRLIAEGNACTPCAFNCTNAAISAGALAKYMSDVANTPAVATEVNGQACASGCGSESGPCCLAGKCQVGNQCANPVPTDAAADTGAHSAVVEAGADAAMDGGGPDADACAPSGGCTADCVAGRHNVTIMVDGCLITECCVLDDAGAD